MQYRAIIVTPGQPAIGQCVVTTYPGVREKRLAERIGSAERRKLDAANFKVMKK